MNAMVFAAGLGTRLKPLTDDNPKALIKVNGKTLIQRVLESLKLQGFLNVVVNVYHYSNKIIDYLEANNFFGLEVKISVEEKLLDTGGGLKKALKYFPDGAILLHNVDVITNLKLKSLWNFNLSTNGLATLAVRKRKTNRYLLFDENNKLVGWENIKENKKILMKNVSPLQRWAFSGVSVVSPLFLRNLPDRDVFSLTQALIEQIGYGEIFAFPEENSFWFDVGTPDKLRKAEEYLRKIES